MGRSEMGALRYALLSTSHAGRQVLWSSDVSLVGADARFKRQVGEACERAREASRDNGRRDGRRTIDNTVTRIARRDAQVAARTALDLQRLDDLCERYRGRQALALRQRWFVIGRVLDAAARDNPRVRALLADVLRGANLRRDERACLERFEDV